MANTNNVPTIVLIALSVLLSGCAGSSNEEIQGCMDDVAQNYDESATLDDGSCSYLDTDGDGVFDHLEIPGCADEDAINYDSSSTDDDGSCT